MENPLTHYEHGEYEKLVNSQFRAVDEKLARLRDEDARLSKRVTALESDNKQINALTLNVQKLADNVEAMRQLQEDEGKRLKAIENRDGEMWRRMLSYAATAIVGLLIGFIFSQLGIE